MSHEDELLHDFHTDLSVGDILRRARLKKNISIEELEQAIRVSAPHLIAIEEGRLEVLPGRVYTLGFIRAYAEHVDLDGERILALLKRQSGEKIAPKDISPPRNYVAEEYSLPPVKVIALVFALLIFTITVKTVLIGGEDAAQEKIPSVPKDLKAQTTLLSKPEQKVVETAAAVEQVSDAQPVPEVPLLATSPDKQVVLKAIDNVWLEIRDATRATVLSRVLSVGEEYWVPQDQVGLVMTLGNAGGLQILVDGEALPILGRKGQVIRKLSLDHDQLKEVLKNAPKKSM